MADWLLRWIGIGDELTSKLEQVQWLWARPGLLWAGLILIVPITLFIIRRHRASLAHVSPAARGMLTTCRVSVLLLLLVVLAGPYLRLQEQTIRKPVLIVMVDESDSMTLPAGPFDDESLNEAAAAIGLLGNMNPDKEEDDKPARPLEPEERRRLQQLSRQQLVREAISHQHEKAFAPLQERFDVRGYRVARRSWSADPFTVPDEPLAAADANETNLGDALERALGEAAGRTIGGVLLFTDGQWTAGPDPGSVVRRLNTGSGANISRAPIFTIPVGSSEPMTDVRIVDVLAPAQMSHGDTAAVLAYVESHGFDGQSVKVRLLDRGNQTLDEVELKLAAGQRQQAQLAFEADQPGATVLSVQVDELPEESVQANNRRQLEVVVDPERLRVLYLEGGPRWDFRFLDHSLRRDSGLETRIVMQSQVEAEHAESEEPLPKLARLPEDAAGFAEYNVVILGDVSPALLTPRLQQQLALAVQEEGLGLIVQGSAQFMPHAFADGPLAELLPVRMVKDAGGIESPAYAPFRMKVEAAGAIHPAFSLYDDATQNRGVWDRMPEFHWAQATADAAPGASVLATYQSAGVHGGEARPLIAEQFAGRGRVLYIGTDSTYRWRRNIGSHLFYRFWGQTIRHVARDPERDGDKSWMQAFPRRVEPGEPVGIELYAVDAEGQPLSSPQVTLRYSALNMMDTMTLERGSDAGLYRGTWRPRELGSYQLSYTDARGRSVTAAVRVAASGRELRNPVVDREALAELAQQSGGRMLEMHQLRRLGELAVGEPEDVEKLHEEELWDNWLTLILLVGLYCTDVGLRRVLGLT